MAGKGEATPTPSPPRTRRGRWATYWRLHERYQDYRYRMFLGLRVLLTDMDSLPRPRRGRRRRARRASSARSR